MQWLTLRLDLVLDYQGLPLVVNLLGKLGGNGMMSSGTLRDKTLVARNARQNSRFFNSPFANVSPVLVRLGVLLLSVRRSPSRLPIIGELLKKRSVDCEGLDAKSQQVSTSWTGANKGENRRRTV